MKLGASLEEAQLMIRSQCCSLPSEDVSILEAVGRVCAAELRADSDLPAQAQSAVDGFAVSDQGIDDLGQYRLAGTSLLGDNPQEPLQPGQAWGVSTGTTLPPGTTAVFPQEKIVRAENTIFAQEPYKPGNNIKQAGEDYTKGDLLITPGMGLSPGAIALLAAFGISQVPVYRKPRVAAVSVSRNIIPWDSQPEPGQTRDCNIPLINAMVMQNGGMVTATRIIGDDNIPALDTFSELLERADILVMVGGTYAARGDEAPLFMQQLGAEVLYWDVPIQPGSHTGAAMLGSKMLFALSGNPAACAVGFQLFAAPAMQSMQGLNPEISPVQATCSNGFDKKSGSRRFIRARAEWDNGWKVTVLPGQKPSMIRSLVNCNALIDMPGGSPPIEAGQEISILML